MGSTTQSVSKIRVPNVHESRALYLSEKSAHLLSGHRLKLTARQIRIPDVPSSVLISEFEPGTVFRNTGTGLAALRHGRAAID